MQRCSAHGARGACARGYGLSGAGAWEARPVRGWHRAGVLSHASRLSCMAWRGQAPAPPRMCCADWGRHFWTGCIPGGRCALVGLREAGDAWGLKRRRGGELHEAWWMQGLGEHGRRGAQAGRMHRWTHDAPLPMTPHALTAEGRGMRGRNPHCRRSAHPPAQFHVADAVPRFLTASPSDLAAACTLLHQRERGAGRLGLN